MRSSPLTILNHVGRTLKIRVTLCLLLLCVNVQLHKTNSAGTANCVRKSFFISPSGTRASVKKRFVLRRANHWGGSLSAHGVAGPPSEAAPSVEGRQSVDEDSHAGGGEHNRLRSGGENCSPRVSNQFADVPEINPNIAKFLSSKGINQMTKIQAQSFRPIYEGRDIIGRSETGSGKTLAFALPLVEKLYKVKMGRSGEGVSPSTPHLESANHFGGTNQPDDSKNPSILVLEPTRELSKQVENTFKEISQFYNFNIMSIYGGESYVYQEAKLRKGIEILTGTPGRIIDHLERKNLSLQNIKYLVLDEADEMLNLGFTHDLERILSYINLKEAQILLYSATTPSWIKDISSKYMKNPFFIDVVDSSNKTSKNIKHIAIKTPYDIKEKALLLEDIILVKSNGGQVIIFTRTKLEADILCSEGSFKSLSFAVLHGNIAQTTREHTMQRFRQGMFQILIATDIAARGLDISNVDLVIQCFPPNYAEIYIHRAGRTGRANKKGISVVLFSTEDKQDLVKIEKNCGIKFSIEQLPNNEDVFTSASTMASKKIQNVNPSVLPFFHKTASELIEKCTQLQMDQTELVARCLAIISKKEHIKKRSLINGLSETLTLSFVNKSRKWKNEDDIIYWVNKISNDLNVNTFNKILQIKIDTRDRFSSYFDLNENIAELFIQNFNNMSKVGHRNMFDLTVARSIPEHVDLTSDFHSSSRYHPRKRYSYRRRPSYY
ncbi:ATP-dependent helicase, putative [Plasmodium vivax]|uniref:RNA helicase n=3 Tax=Plasmodium vivax TaxID=5855 RepID=A0A1G4HEL7_PLAVI|nr:ATP-dependent helicase [Plasmodium vivax India VII]KNA02315.1 ATP-dependent helicase [Plasmodium vivax North Korean]SCO73308.1 ATP-dependent helicase, putative [Plasmodium vivax]